LIYAILRNHLADDPFLRCQLTQAGVASVACGKPRK